MRVKIKTSRSINVAFHCVSISGSEMMKTGERERGEKMHIQMRARMYVIPS